MRELWGWPIGTWLVLAWFALACIQTYDKRLLQAIKAAQGEYPKELPLRGHLLVELGIFPQYAALAYLAYLDWRQALSVYVLTFLAAVFLSPVMEAIGATLLIPSFVLKRVIRRRGPD